MEDAFLKQNTVRRAPAGRDFEVIMPLAKCSQSGKAQLCPDGETVRRAPAGRDFEVIMPLAKYSQSSKSQLCPDGGTVRHAPAGRDFEVIIASNPQNFNTTFFPFMKDS